MKTKSCTPKDMEPAEIRSRLIRAKVAQSAIAQNLGVSPSMVNRTIDHLSVSDRVRRAIAEAVSLDVARIWPSTYLCGGPRKPGRPSATG